MARKPQTIYGYFNEYSEEMKGHIKFKYRRKTIINY